MKKWICANQTTNKNKQIVITMLIASPSNNIAASQYIVHPSNINKKLKISDKHLQYLNDIVATFDHNLQAAKFDILSRKQSKKSYAYYITFVPITDKGERLTPVDIIFRVAEHTNAFAENSDNSSFARIVGFTLENENFDKASELIYEGVRIIKELKKGNVNILDEI